MTLARFLALVAEHCRRRAVVIVLGGLVLAVLSGWLAATRLGVSTDTDALFSDSLPWRQRAMELDRDFPQFQNLLVAVIDAVNPETADATAAGLAAALAQDKEHFQSVTRPDASPFLQQNGLLFLNKDELQDVLDRTIDAQPFLGQLVADPSARGLFAALSLLAMGAEHEANLGPFAGALREFHKALESAAAGKAQPLSWQGLLGGGLAEKAGKYRFVQVQPRIDHSALEPAGAASAALRKAAAGLEFVRDGTARVRLTGQPALADEEFSTVAQGAVAGTIGSAVLVLLWLTMAMRSWRLIVPVVATTALGLFLTTGFAALAIGTLNLISVAFAVLFVGLAVDFCIQFCVRAREVRRVMGMGGFLAGTAEIAGPPILIAAAAAAAGFLAFAPTSFRGVAELGLIAGVGMVIAFICTFTFLPAALSLTRPRGEKAEIGLRAGAWLELVLNEQRTLVLGIFVLAGAAGAALLPMVHFDSDPLHTKDPTTEAMRTLSDLMDEPLTNPYSADILAPSRAAADALVPKLAALKQAGEVITLSSFIPDNQAEKLALIADAAGILAPTLAERSPAAPVTAADIRLAAGTARAQIEHASARLKPGDPLLAIGGDLARLEKAPDNVLISANKALTRFLPDQLARLRLALEAKPVTVADIPPDIARDWLLPDGRVRVHVVPKLGTALVPFVAALREVAPDAGGSAVTIVETASTIVSAFRQATIGAVLAITVLLVLVLQRTFDVAVVLLALALSALITVALAVGLGMSFNFANIIALPLLQGVGVSFNIYFVMNWRAGHARFLGTATARAILFSALTTATAFGSLALSHHPGTASMGKLLLLSLGSTLAVTLLCLPVALRALMRDR